MKFDFNNLMMRSPVNPGSHLEFKDPIAQQTSWLPKRFGGNPWKNRKFVQVNSGRVELQASSIFSFIVAIILIVFMVVPFVGLMSFVTYESYTTAGLDEDFFWLVGMIVFFVAIMVFVFLRRDRTVIFDKTHGVYWHGKPSKAQSMSFSAPATKTYPLTEIHAIQILGERISTKNSSYNSYEINLVLRDASRFNVADHKQLDAIRQDAQSLAQFLGVPVWDVTLDSKKDELPMMQ